MSVLDKNSPTLRATFIWWWVLLLGINLPIFEVFSLLVNVILSWLGNTELGSILQNRLGFSIIFLICCGISAVLWIILVIIVYLLKLIIFLSPIIILATSFYLAKRALESLRPTADPLLSHFQWQDYFCAVFSMPLAIVVFIFVLQSPPNPVYITEIKSLNLPELIYNFWLIVVGIVGWVFTWIALNVISKRRFIVQPVANARKEMTIYMHCPVCGAENPITRTNCIKCQVNLKWASKQAEEDGAKIAKPPESR